MSNRIATIIGGYIAACVAAAVVFTIAFGFNLGLTMVFADHIKTSVLAAVAVSIYMTCLVAIFALLPAVVAIICAEHANVRFVLWYGLGGAAVGVLSLGLYGLLLIFGPDSVKNFFDGAPTGSLASALGFFGGPGFVGGLVYWLIAGRKAGRDSHLPATAH